MKNYEFKVYWLDWTFKKTIDWEKVASDLSFTSNINWVQWQCNISLNYAIDDILWFSESDMIKIYVYDDLFPDWKLIFTWQIQIVEQNYVENQQSITLTCFWLWVLLNNLLFQSWWSRIFTKDQDPAQTVKDIIDYFNTIYTWSWLSYTWTSIIDFWSDINISFDNDSCFKSIKSIQKATESFYFYIHNNWVIYYRANTDSNNTLHKATSQKNAQSIQIKNSIEDLANFWYITYWSWDTSYNDSTSISTYWRVDNYQNQTDLGDIWSATTFITDYINENKNVSTETQIVLNNSYNFITYSPIDSWAEIDTLWAIDYIWKTNQTIEDIKPWDRLTILNFPIDIIEKQVTRIRYSPTQLVINLENYLSLNKVLF